jgi:hypothetical protein
MRKLIKSKLVRQGLTFLHWGLTIPPLLLLVGLFGMSARTEHLIGEFPKPSINDPYQLGKDDLIYQNWITFTRGSLDLTVLGLILWFCLTTVTFLFHRRYWSKEESSTITLHRFLPIGIYVFIHLVILFEPTRRLDWFFD